MNKAAQLGWVAVLGFATIISALEARPPRPNARENRFIHKVTNKANHPIWIGQLSIRKVCTVLSSDASDCWYEKRVIAQAWWKLMPTKTLSLRHAEHSCVAITYGDRDLLAESLNRGDLYINATIKSVMLHTSKLTYIKYNSTNGRWNAYATLGKEPNKTSHRWANLTNADLNKKLKTIGMKSYKCFFKKGNGTTAW